MSTPHFRLTPAPVRQDALCMCVTGGACTSFAPGHAVHLIQARLVSATPTEWVDAIVVATDAGAGTVSLHTLDGEAIEVWNGLGAASTVETGEPVSFHPRYHVLNAGGELFNCARF